MNAALSKEQVARMLSQNVGVEKARELVDAAAAELGLVDPLTREQCLRLLERVAAEPGIIGIAARFAKSRVILGNNK